MNRLSTAVLLLAVFIPALFFAPAVLWALLIALVAGAAAFEWARISAFPSFLPLMYAIGMGVLAVIIYLMPQQAGAMLVLYAMAAVFWGLVAPLWLAGRWHGTGFFVRALVGTLVILPTWAAIGSAAHRASMRSSTPPCPGNRVPLSLTPATRFIQDSNRSPRMEKYSSAAASSSAPGTRSP